MIRSTNRLFWGVLLVTGLVATSGCKKGPGRDIIDPATLIGEWVEVPEQAAANPRFAGGGGEAELVRHLSMKADNTFEQTYSTAAGKETKDKITGTWKIDQTENVVMFEITDATFGKNDERRDSAPESSLGIHKQDVKGEGSIEVFLVDDLMGGNVTFKRAN